jgi:hypothetical protein
MHAVQNAFSASCSRSSKRQHREEIFSLFADADADEAV